MKNADKQTELTLEVQEDLCKLRGINLDGTNSSRVGANYEELEGRSTEMNSASLGRLQLEARIIRAREQELVGKLVTLQSELDDFKADLANLKQGFRYRTGDLIAKAFRNRKLIVKLPFLLFDLYKQWKRVGVLKKTDGDKVKNVAIEKTKVANLGQTDDRSLRGAQVPRIGRVFNGLNGRSLPPLAGFQQGTRVACILDEFSYACFSPEAEFKQLSLYDWKHELETFKPDLLLVESAWRGDKGLWKDKLANCGEAISGILQWCKESSVPTAFWNKEDPVHFSSFLNLASKFDAVFTTDLSCVPRYKRYLSHENIFFLPFAAQLRVHNPVEKYERKDAVSFAGSFYARYPERTKALESIVGEVSKESGFIIFDRNYGNEDPNFKFPPNYGKFIVDSLAPEEIDYAYKGFTSALNLNSVNSSQTMLARRVFELIASNTLVLSNYSAAVRALFGDLVLATDDGKQMVERIERLNELKHGDRRLRSMALRHVLNEHTYTERLNFILEKLHIRGEERKERIGVVLICENRDALFRQLEIVNSQTLPPSEITVISDQITPDTEFPSIRIISNEVAMKMSLKEFCPNVEFLSFLFANDYYGPHYLEDLLLANRYVNVPVISKGQFEVASNSPFASLHEYCTTDRLPVRSSMFNLRLIGDAKASYIVKDLESATSSPGGPLFVIDSLDYLYNGILSNGENPSDLPLTNQGFSLQALRSTPELNLHTDSDTPCFDLDKFAALFSSVNDESLSVERDPLGIAINSNVGPRMHKYIYAGEVMNIDTIRWGENGVLFVDSSPSLDVMPVILFLDKGLKRLNHAMGKVNSNIRFSIPPETQYLWFGFRVKGRGKALVSNIVPAEFKMPGVAIRTTSSVVVLTNVYPAYDNLYRNGFVHSRVRSYLDHGLDVTVVCVADTPITKYREFEGVQVITTNVDEASALIKNNEVNSVLVHFLDPQIWRIVSNLPEDKKVRVWVHGSEVQPWWRREYNATNADELEKLKIASKSRVEFWRFVFDNIPENLEFVFVSQYFANEVMQDMDRVLPEGKYHIIHNPIDGQVFDYVEKGIDQRKRILSIRPYASRKYANDISVAVVLDLAGERFFNDLEFCFIGDGPLFDEILSPLKDFPNVKCVKKFLTHEEIAQLHKEFGLLLTPTRMDAQGVSRDEGMSSGLVPLTTEVAAVPEFVDAECGFLAPFEDHKMLAEAIKKLYFNPELFAKMSKKAAERVRLQSGSRVILEKELQMIGRKSVGD